ncbi:hypothetical protein [Streptomyces olivaceoviridis]|uniref:hypothetical protein n=1 Tax=Streptomyces olivaceoviridis TaxID=1921 RepID=UPI0036FDAB81
MAENLAAKGLTLPRDFVTFQADSKLHCSLEEVSVTCCWTDISEPLPSPAEPGAFLVRFLRDQQDCVIWYLYLRPSGEVFVVHSSLDYEYEYEARRDGEETETDLDDPEEQRAAILWCAPSFEEFAHRFWIENRLWHALVRCVTTCATTRRPGHPHDRALKESILTAADDLARTLSDPNTVFSAHPQLGHRSQSLAHGAAGIALLHIERARAGRGDWATALG